MANHACEITRVASNHLHFLATRKGYDICRAKRVKVNTIQYYCLQIAQHVSVISICKSTLQHNFIKFNIFV